MIAIDGPAASGKSTLALRLARELGYIYFDTGAMYRAVTLTALKQKMDLTDEAAITRLAEEIVIDILPASQQDGRDSDVLVDGADITWDIRTPDVDRNVSMVSAYAGVRSAMTAQQRRVGLRGNVVMAGRDIGTVVLPEADLKVYLDASVEERARRRYQELVKRGQPADLQEITAAMRERDRIDSTRQVAPLSVAQDARILNSDALDAEQVLQVVKNWACSKSLD